MDQSQKILLICFNIDDTQKLGTFDLSTQSKSLNILLHKYWNIGTNTFLQHLELDMIKHISFSSGM